MVSAILAAGLVGRYMVDFAWLFALAALLLLFWLYSRFDGYQNLQHRVFIVIFVLMVCSSLVMLLISFSGENDWMLINRPRIYYTLRYLFTLG